MNRGTKSTLPAPCDRILSHHPSDNKTTEKTIPMDDKEATNPYQSTPHPSLNTTRPMSPSRPRWKAFLWLNVALLGFFAALCLAPYVCNWIAFSQGLKSRSGDPITFQTITVYWSPGFFWVIVSIPIFANVGLMLFTNNPR